MNTEQIAQEVDNELCVEGIDIEANEFPAEFLRRCLSKLAEQAGEPVAWHTDDHLSDKSATTYDRDVAKRWNEKGWPTTRLYTESQLIAAQQKAAEACAKLLNDNLGHLTRGDALVAIRNGEWREYL